MDTFLEQTHCERCHKPLIVRIMSWFNKQTICMTCSAEEDKIKKALRTKGIKDAMEGCGFIPQKGKDYT